MLKSRLYLLLIASGLTLSCVTGAADLTDADQIVHQANLVQYYAANDGRSIARMTIIDARGNRQMRQFTILRKDVEEGADQRYLVVFSRPPDVHGTVFRVEKHVKRDDDRWLYLPDLDLVKRISAGDKRTSFVGTHYYYEDVSGRNENEDAHELEETTDTYYVIKNTPRNPGSVEFAYYRAWVDKKSFLPMKSIYYDQSDKEYRRIEVEKTEDFQGHTTATQVKVSDLISGGHTLAKFRYIQYDMGMPDNIFSERSLRNPPAKWLKAQ